MGSQRHAPAALPLGKGTCTHCTGGWVAPQGRVARSEHGMCIKTVKHRPNYGHFILPFRLISPHNTRITKQRRDIRFSRQWPWRLGFSALTPCCIATKEQKSFLHHCREPTACPRTSVPTYKPTQGNIPQVTIFKLHTTLLYFRTKLELHRLLSIEGKMIIR